MKITTLERKARTAIKNLPEVRCLDRKKNRIEKSVTAGKLSRSLARDQKRLLNLRKRRCLNREMYRQMRAVNCINENQPA